MSPIDRSKAASPGWYADPHDPFTQRWWDGSTWTDQVAPASPMTGTVLPEPTLPSGPSSSTNAKGAALEERIAAFIESLGYQAQTNMVLEGRSGARHEIDVLGEKRDALSTFRVAVECKAWTQPIEKDVVAKFSYVLGDLGLREGIIVALGGARSGATTAATELGITLWGPDELRERLGAADMADLTTQAPRHEASGLAPSIDARTAATLMEREARGRFGIGAEAIVWTSLVWLPVAIVQLALSRTEGRFKKVTQTRRIWNAYDQVSGGLVAAWQAPPPITQVDLANRALRPKQRESSYARVINDSISRFRSVSTDAARARHAQRLTGLGIPIDYTVVPETTNAAFTPLFVAIAHRKAAERVIVVDAHRGELHSGLARALSENVHWLRESLT